MTEKKCYTIKEVQEMLGMGRRAVTSLLEKREFRWVVIGGRYRIPKKNFDEWLEGKMQEAEDPTEEQEKETVIEPEWSVWKI